MEKQKKIYIASPYTLGDVAVNVKRQIDAAEELIEAGFVPFAPLMMHFHHIIYPHDYDTWTKVMMPWVLVCDAVWRLSGDSNGADAEVTTAKANQIPVYYSMKAIKSFFYVKE